MSHTPFGYRIKNGKAIVDVEEAEKIRVLFQAYLSGAALTTAAKEAAIHAFHSGIRHSKRPYVRNCLTQTDSEMEYPQAHAPRRPQKLLLYGL